jgi:hypothetical protein
MMDTSVLTDSIPSLLKEHGSESGGGGDQRAPSSRLVTQAFPGTRIWNKRSPIRVKQR